MGKRFIPIVIAAILVAVGFTAITLISGQHHQVKPQSARSGSVAESPATGQALPEAKPTAENAAGKEQPTVADKGQPVKAAPAQKPADQQKPAAGGRPQASPANGNQPPHPRREYTFQLMHMVRNIGEMEKDGKHALTSAQAKQVLAILKPLRSKPKLTEEEAGAALKSLKRVLTADQLNAMSRLTPSFPGGGRPGQGGTHQWQPGQGQRPQWQGGMRPGGPGGPPPGGQPGANGQPGPGRMMDFNPFSAKAPSGNERAGEMVKRMNEFFANLEKKAKG